MYLTLVFEDMTTKEYLLTIIPTSKQVLKISIDALKVSLVKLKFPV